MNELTQDPAGCYRQMEQISLSKKPCGNSHTSEPAMSPVVPHIPTTRIFEVIIRKNAEPGRNNSNDRRRERMRSYIAMLRRPKAGGDVVWDAASTNRGIFLHPPRER